MPVADERRNVRLQASVSCAGRACRSAGPRHRLQRMAVPV